MKLGILGGTFDPVHKAHLMCGEEARRQLDLDEVLFVPAGEPWMKAGTEISPAQHRLNMTSLAIQPYPAFRVSSMEIDRPGPTYTVDTLAALHRESEPGTEHFLILGIDSLCTLPRWKDPARVLDLCTLVGVPRPELGEYDICVLDGIRPGASRKIVMLEQPVLEISSSRIRENIARGLGEVEGVPPQVMKYIDAHGLYRDGR